MSPVIGQGIVLSEKWPGIFVVAERGNDFETRPRGNGVGEEVVRERKGYLDASSLEPVLLTRAHARIRLRERVAIRDATHMSPRVCAFMQFVTRETGIPPLK